MKLTLPFTILAFAATLAAVPAQANDYLPAETDSSYETADDSLLAARRNLGSQRLLFGRNGRQVVRTGNCNMRSETVDAIRLRFTYSRVFVSSIRINLNNGRSVNVRVNRVFRPGTRTPWINLGRSDRWNWMGQCVTSVEIEGQNISFRRPGYVTVIGNVNPLRDGGWGRDRDDRRDGDDRDNDRGRGDRGGRR